MATPAITIIGLVLITFFLLFQSESSVAQGYHDSPPWQRRGEGWFGQSPNRSQRILIEPPLTPPLRLCPTNRREVPDTQSAFADRQFGTSFCTILSNPLCPQSY